MDDDVLAVAHVHVLVQMLADAKVQIAQLHSALDSRTMIEQAQGIVMARLDVDTEAAADYLKRVSVESRRQLTDIAREIAITRALPDGG